MLTALSCSLCTMQCLLLSGMPPAKRHGGRLFKRAVLAAGKQYPVTINEMLLRGCTLKNSKSIIGAVVYTGAESRIQKNSAKTPHKVGAYSKMKCVLTLQQPGALLSAARLTACLLCSSSAVCRAAVRITHSLT